MKTPICSLSQILRRDRYRILNWLEHSRYFDDARCANGSVSQSRLPHPDIMRRTNALKGLPGLVKPLIKAAMRDQIASVGELCVPGRDDVDDDYPVNEDINVFSKEVIERYGICSGDAWKSEGYDMAEMTLHTAGELK